MIVTYSVREKSNSISDIDQQGENVDIMFKKARDIFNAIPTVEALHKVMHLILFFSQLIIEHLAELQNNRFEILTAKQMKAKPEKNQLRVIDYDKGEDAYTQDLERVLKR